MCARGVVDSKNVPACVRGYAVRRPGIFYTFYFTLCAVSYDFGSTMVSSFVVLCAQVVLLAQRMCPHASGVMLSGARGFFTHLIYLVCSIVRFWVRNGVKFC